MTSPKFRASPSLIGRYFFHHCERFFRFSASAKGEPGVPKKQFQASEVMRQVLEDGTRWEEQVLSEYLGEAALIAPGDGPPSERYWSVEDSQRLLAQAPVGSFIYQPTLRPGDGFYRRHEIDPALVRFGDCRPDLLWVTERAGRRALVVMDVKRGESLRPTYRVQVLVYALMLSSIVDELGIDAQVVTDEGGVWLGGKREPTMCALEQLTPHVREFLRDGMREVLTRPIEDVPWHVQYRCEWCEFHAHCDEEMRRECDVSQLTRVTPYGKRFLVEDLGVRTLTDMRSFLERGDSVVDEALSACASLAGSRPYLRAKTEALSDGEVRAYDARTELFPQFSHIKVFFTLQWEPLGDTIFYAGLRVHAAKNTPAMVLGQFGVEQQETVSFIAGSAHDGADVRRDFVLTLHELLARVDGFNVTREWKEQLSVQVIAYSQRERALLERMLLEALEDDETAEAAMSLLLFLATPELIHLGDQPGEDPVGNPVTVLLDGLSRLYAVPVPVSYTLPETLEAFGADFYERSVAYHFPLGHALRSDVVHRAWFRGEREGLERFQRAAWLFLRAVETLYWKAYFRAKEEGLLEDWPPKFRLPASTPIADPLLARLAFFARYESLSRCKAVREARDAPLEVQRLDGTVLELEALHDRGHFAVVGGLLEVEPSAFGNWLLVPATPTGRKAARSFPDYYARGRMVMRTRAHPERALVKLPAVERDELGTPLRLSVDWVKEFAGRTVSPGERFLLYDRFTDYTTDTIVGFLQKLDASPRGLFRGLMEDPEIGLQPTALDAEVAAHLDTLTEQVDFTASKQAAFDAIRARKATVVWGPPGTGKTYFLAATICALAEAHARAGRPFRVVVTAFTHAAIENLLREVAKVATRLNIDVDLAKVGSWDRQAVGATLDRREGLSKYQRSRPRTVVGTTVYQLAKEELGALDVDLVVVDEASQVRVPEAAIPAAFVGPRGRIVFAGDDYQLPPIVAGKYTEPRSGPVLHRSIFEALLRRDEHGVPGTAIVHQLQENYRMNDVLTGLARELLYPGYACASEKISGQRLALRMLDDGAEVAWLLDPGFPLTVVIVEGVQAARENAVEADLVTRLSLALREGLPYEDDTEFWREGLFVVSPHRAQNQLIRRQLARARDWSAAPFVDTVDKMQGQEADAVIISYGVADPEYAVREGQFIYSRNRLNVAMTRARAKSVLIVSRPLLEPLPDVLEDDEAALGLAYMRATVQAVRDRGERREAILADGARLQMYRSALQEA